MTQQIDPRRLVSFSPAVHGSIFFAQLKSIFFAQLSWNGVSGKLERGARDNSANLVWQLLDSETIAGL